MRAPNAKATHLPSEILVAIFSQVPKETQIVCQYVCKSWHYPARQLFYNTIIIMGKRNGQLSKLLYCLENSLVGSMVKVLQIEGDRKPVLTRQELITLITLCPNIQELAMCNSAAYFQWLLEDKDVALNDLKTFSTLGRISWRNSERNGYFYESAGKFAKSIQVLQIPCSCSTVIEEKYGNILNYLQQFTRLKELTMIDGSQRYLVYFHSLLNACQGLEKLNIGLGHPLFDPAKINAIDLHNYSINTYPTMHELTMFFPNFSIDYFRYIIKRFVNIRKLHVTINQSKEDWFEDKKKIRQFMLQEYIPLVKKLESASLAIKINGFSCSSDFFSEYTKNMVGSSTKIDSQFEIDGGHAERDDIRLNAACKDNKLYATSHCSSTRDFSYGSSEFPFKSHLEKYGNHISRLEFKLSKTVKRAVDLGSILYQCPNMEVLEIDIAQPTPKEYSWDSLLQICNGTPNIYMNQSQQQQVGFHHEKLFTLNLCGAMITTALLHSLSTLTPNLQKLSLMNCSYNLPEGAMDIQQEPCRFDMSKLSLNQITLDTSFFYNPFRQYTYFKITKTSTKSSDYFILDQQAATDGNDASFNQVTEEFLYNHCAAAVDQSHFLAVEFIFKAVDNMTIHVGKYPHQQKIRYVSFSDDSLTF